MIQYYTSIVDFFTNCWRTISVLMIGWHAFGPRKLQAYPVSSPSEKQVTKRARKQEQLQLEKLKKE